MPVITSYDLTREVISLDFKKEQILQSFDGDGYHMMGKSPESKKLANEIANQILQSVKINESITLNYILDLITEVTEKQ